MAVSPERKVRQFDKVKTIQCVILLSASIMLSVVAIFIVRKKKHWFVMDNFRKNPYRLVYNVLFSITNLLEEQKETKSHLCYFHMIMKDLCGICRKCKLV